ncbi:alpha/beta fold hydrolase [Sulfurimonas diazotrophicus]|uniref:Alpha/beta fold hydrolase n=1 Tax=Sulfurimonas diazotrophicus TaxID=3131939 RepID=A0ABZ3HCC8_9BACT
MTTTVNGIEIHYDDLGSVDMPALIFLHGFPLNRTMWQRQAEACRKHCRVIAYDLRGHGETEGGEEPFSIPLFVQDLLSLMDALRVKTATLCALSMGGYIALRAAEEHPERFNALILCDTQCAADTPEGREKRLKAIRAIETDGVEPFAEGLLGKLLAEQTFEQHPETVAAVREMIVSTPAHSLVHSLRAMRERDETCSLLPRLTLPVLILVGEADQIAPPDASVYMHNALPAAELVIIEGAGHLSNLENPEAFNAALLPFLSGHCHRD